MAKLNGLKLFYSYSNKDEGFREELEEHLSILRRKSLIDDWHFRKINAGDDWEEVTLSTLESSDIILLLISSSFINSTYCYGKEMEIAMQMHHEGKCRVIPIYIRPCNYEGAPFEALQGLPRNLQPVSKCHDKDSAWAEISSKIEIVCNDLLITRRNTSKVGLNSEKEVWSKMTKSSFDHLCKELFDYYEASLIKENPSISKLEYQSIFSKDELEKFENYTSNSFAIDAVLIFVNSALSDIDRTNIMLNLPILNAELIIWDRSSIIEKIEQNGALSFLYDLSFDSFEDNSKVINNKGAVNFLDHSNFINRKDELKLIKDFLRSESKSLLTITGLPGIGKSVLSNHAYHQNKSYFLDFCIIRFKDNTSLFDILHIINESFLSAGIYDFNQIYSNSGYTDEIRLNTLISILNKNRFLYLFDNFEDYLDNYKIKGSFMSDLIGSILTFGSLSKIIITSRIHPLQQFKKNIFGQSILLRPIKENVFYDEYLPSLPNIHAKIHREGKRSLSVEKELYKITGGVPLSLDLLEKYLKFLPIEGAIASSSQELEKIIVNDILNSLKEKYEKALIAIALFDDAIDYKFFKHFDLGNSDIEVLVNTGIIIYNSKHYKYLMHAFIRLILIKRYSKDVISNLRKELIHYLSTAYSLDSYDSLNSLLIQKKKLELMVKSEMFDIAAEHLGRIATRLISINSVDEVSEYLQLIEDKITQKSSTIWLLNVEAHVLDFRKNFDQTISLYERMYRESRNMNNVELEVLSCSNFATTFRRKGQFGKATSMYILALEVARKFKLMKLQGSILNNMGQNYIYNNQLIEATISLEECIKIRGEMNDEFRLAASLTHFGSLCLKICETWDNIVDEFQSRFSDERNRKEFWLETALIKITTSLKLQKKQKNFWLVDRSYDQLSRYWQFKGDDRKTNIYKSQANRNRALRGVSEDKRFN